MTSIPASTSMIILLIDERPDVIDHVIADIDLPQRGQACETLELRLRQAERAERPQLLQPRQRRQISEGIVRNIEVGERREGLDPREARQIFVDERQLRHV